MSERIRFYQNAESGMIISLVVDPEGQPFGDHDFINLIYVQGFPRQPWQSYWSARMNLSDRETAELLFDTLEQVSRVNQDHPRHIVAIWRKYITDSTNMEAVLDRYGEG